MSRVLLPRLLLDAGLADVATLGLATSIAAEADVSLVHALCRWRLVSAVALCDVFVDLVHQRPFDLDSVVEFPAIAGVHRQLCARLRVLPVWSRNGVLGLGLTDPTDDGAVDQVVRACGLSVDRLLVNDDALERALRRAFAPGDSRAPPPSSPPPSSGLTAMPGLSRSATAPMPGVAQVAHAARVAPALTSPFSLRTSKAGSMDVVLGEPSSIDLFGLAEVAGSAMFMDVVDPTMVSFAPISPLASLSGSTPTRTPPHRTMTPDAATMPMRAPPGAPPPGLSVEPDVGFVSDAKLLRGGRGNLPADELSMQRDETREVDRRDTAALLNDATWDGTGALQVVQVVASDDRTIPDDSLMFLMRVLVVADGATALALSARLRPRIKQLAVVPMAQAIPTLQERRFDEIVVVDPPDTVAGSQVLATIAARAKNGAVIFTGISDFARLPGVRSSWPLPPTTAEICDRVVEVLSKRAHGEA